jgi:REP element-mobilizing transposase RayT
LQAGGYFITICTYNREYLFGEVINRQIVKQWWLKSEANLPILSWKIM